MIQRLEFWKTGSAIIADHPIFGVGTVEMWKKSFASKYDEIQTNSIRNFDEGNTIIT
ncbi:MAG: O-antigen ligase family protein [Flavobacteriales bacterium]|nr:O-antigen ligase family protein [Flavobacteriales bacterium]